MTDYETMRACIFLYARAFVIMLLSCIAVLRSPSAAEEVRWHVLTWGDARPYTAGIQELAKNLAEVSGGAFTIGVFSGDPITQPSENLEVIQFGGFEMATICSAYHPDKTPVLSGLDLPFLPFGNLNVQQRVHEAYYARPEVAKEMKRWNAKVFMSGLLPQSEFVGVGNPPKQINDWKGMRVRSIGGVSDVMREFGAVAVPVEAPAVHASLLNGTVQAVSFPAYAHMAYNTDEIGTWYTKGLTVGSANCPVIMNIQAYEALPEQYKIWLNESKAHAYKTLKNAYKQSDMEFYASSSRNMEAVVYSRADREKIEELFARKIWNTWADDMNSRGLPGEELLDFIISESKKAESKS